jgi:hypothetical protein
VDWTVPESVVFVKSKKRRGAPREECAFSPCENRVFERVGERGIDPGELANGSKLRGDLRSLYALDFCPAFPSGICRRKDEKTLEQIGVTVAELLEHPIGAVCVRNVMVLDDGTLLTSAIEPARDGCGDSLVTDENPLPPCTRAMKLHELAHVVEYRRADDVDARQRRKSLRCRNHPPTVLKKREFMVPRLVGRGIVEKVTVILRHKSLNEYTQVNGDFALHARPPFLCRKLTVQKRNIREPSMIGEKCRCVKSALII